MRRIMFVLLIGTGFILIAMAILPAAIAVNQLRSHAAIEKSQDCMEPIEVNYLAPEIQLNDIAGSLVSLADHGGNLIYLYTWET